MQTTNACLSGLMLVALSQNTSAADSGPFVGVGVGYAMVDGVANAAANGPFTQFPPPSLSIDGIPFDGDDTSVLGFLGYNFNRYVGVELSFWELGEFESVPLSFNRDRATLSADEWVLAARFRYPLTDRFIALWFAGVSRTTFDVEGVVVAIGPTGSVEIPLATPDDETGIVWGAGFGWQFNEHFGVGIDYRQHRIEVTDVETVNLTVTWSP